MNAKTKRSVCAAVKRTFAAAFALSLGMHLAVNVRAEDRFGELVEAGFPPSYAIKLEKLSEAYPAWHFTPLNITKMNGTYTFAYVLSRETEDPETNLVPPRSVEQNREPRNKPMQL